MISDKLRIIYTATDETDALAASLKTLELRPPSIDYDVYIACEHGSPCEEMVKAATGVEILQSDNQMDLRSSVRKILASNDYTFSMMLHPDTIFLHKDWCDIVLSQMLALGVQLFGSSEYQKVSVDGGDLSLIPSWMYVVTREGVQQLDHLFSNCPVYGGAINHVETLRKIGSRSVAACSFAGIFYHYGICKADQAGAASVDELRECVQRRGRS